MILATHKKDVVAAAKKADEISAKAEDDEASNNMSCALATADNTTPAILATAQKLSEKSLKKTPGSDRFLDTLARVHAAKGDFAKAVELQIRAVEKASGSEHKSRLTQTFDAYKAGKIPSL